MYVDTGHSQPACGHAGALWLPVQDTGLERFVPAFGKGRTGSWCPWCAALGGEECPSPWTAGCDCAEGPAGAVSAGAAVVGSGKLQSAPGFEGLSTLGK